ncbi:MAG: hypothetical protein OFPI_06700 [Osedax symbiont Rs2]|nr:MAG: hypothetical protein OFPI_06700 [Osedax symbiont Rs2]
MDNKAVMQAYNFHERVNLQISGYQKIARSELVKFVSQDQQGSFIGYFDSNDQDIDAIIASEIDYFKKMQRSFEWKTYDLDLPQDMGKRLEAHGFIADQPESFMLLDLRSRLATCTNTDVCVEVVDRAGITDAISVQEAVWGGDLSDKLNHLVLTGQQNPENLTVYVIYQDDIPVSSAWIMYNDNSPFAGIWGGSTLPQYRGRGYYSALLNKRISDAKQRGMKYLCIDASEMSRPIVARHGFEFICYTTPYIYQI